MAKWAGAGGGLIEAGQAQVFVQETFELEEAAQALEVVANQHVHGNVVLRVPHRQALVWG
jgi:NADPH:quinone reductase-like Zn-dependent oxidoreductase